MTQQEFEKVKKKVEKSGLKQQEYLIKSITQKNIISTEGMKTLMPELKRIGNNLNQIARSCNEGNQATFIEVQKQQRNCGKKQMVGSTNTLFRVLHLKKN